MKPTWKEATREYLEHCRARGLAPKTIDSRRSTFNRFLEVNGNVQVWSVSAKQVDKVFAKHNWGPGTRNQKLTHFKVFFGWCRARGYMHRDSNPLFGWRMETLANPDRLRIPHADWHLLFDACEDQLDTMLIATGLYLFVRSNEAKGIQLKHIHLDQGEVAIYRSKTKDYDILPISSELDVLLREHLTWMASKGWSDPEHYLLLARTKPVYHKSVGGFLKRSGSFDPTKSTAYCHPSIQRVLNRAGMSTFKEGGHTLRRSGARAYFDVLVQHGYDGALRRVQSMLGHSQSAMTERYLGLNLDRRARNKALAGKPMFPTVQDAKVIPIRKEM